MLSPWECTEVHPQNFAQCTIGSSSVHSEHERRPSRLNSVLAEQVGEKKKALGRDSTSFDALEI